MIVIPTGTDAPIYHWPYATVGLIILNVVLIVLVPPVAGSAALDDNGDAIEGVETLSNFERYALAIGDGRLHPIQWVTHNFLHLGYLHLAGNMLFLWAFGIVVEGKLGPAKYLLTCAAIGTLHGAFVQSLLLRSGMDEHAAGASAIIYGLLAVCMIWAPRNELNCTVILTAGFRIWVFQWDLFYTTVALFYIGTEAFWLLFGGAFGGRIMVSELGHLSGAFWGAVVAIALLKARLVDCENWDLFSLWERRQKLAQDWKRREARLDYPKNQARERKKSRARVGSSGQAEEPDGDGRSPEIQSAKAVRRIQSLIDAGDVPAALGAYNDAAKTLFNWPSQTDLYAMIKALHARGAETDSVRLMRDHCRYYPEDSTKVRLKLAQILIRNCQRPTAALRVLGEMPTGSLPMDLETARQKLVHLAHRRLEEGEIEVEGDD